MRKHNEGYALVLVLVVLIVLGLLSAVILTGAQRNLEVHRSGVETMQNKYQAMGEIEKIIGALEAFDGKSFVILKPKENETNWELQYADNVIQIISTCGDDRNKVQIDCTLVIDGVINEHPDRLEVIHLKGYTITSYEISTIGGAN